MYPFASDSVFVVVIKFSIVKRSTTCFSIRFSVEFTCGYVRAVSSVVRTLASHARGHRFKSSTAHHAEVAEWQTRYVQGVVSLWACEFKSHLRHY